MDNTIFRPHYWLTALLSAALAACQTMPLQERNLPSIAAALDQEVQASAPVPATTTPPEVAASLLPRVQADIPKTVPAVQPHFDISVNAAPAREFFMSLVKGTTLNMVVHPDVNGTVSISLRNITIDEVMDTASDVYGYRYRRSGNTYQVYPARIRTQIFKVDYLDVTRNSGSRTMVSSGSISNHSDSSGSSASSSAATGESGSASGGSEASGSVVTTRSESDFWADLKESLNLIVGDKDGRKVMCHPQSGVIVVHAMPEELRDIEDFLNTIQEASHRLVILEAKIIEVTLNDKFQAGINWNALIEFGDDKSILFGHSGGGSVFETGATALAGTVVPLVRGTQVTGFDTTAFGGIFTIDANLKDFNALIELLKTQGDVQVLSSPRISTINNQKAVIKVGQDEYFVTDVETDTDTTDAGINQSVDVTLTPFFSGVALDVIPQISDDNMVILHVHPSISEVTEKVKNIKVSTNDDLSIPLALSTIRESDTVIRAASGQVVVLGGLMKDVLRDAETRTPFLGDAPVVGHMFRHRREIMTKSELVILLRPVVINSNEQWHGQLRDTAQRFQDLRSTNQNDE
ncbi:MAG: pilus (MSHA type) biogenesis protein MshL [Gammaproteobacteria bacterium]